MSCGRWRCWRRPETERCDRWDAASVQGDLRELRDPAPACRPASTGRAARPRLPDRSPDLAAGLMPLPAAAGQPLPAPVSGDEIRDAQKRQSSFHSPRAMPKLFSHSLLGARGFPGRHFRNAKLASQMPKVTSQVFRTWWCSAAGFLRRCPVRRSKPHRCRRGGSRRAG